MRLAFLCLLAALSPAWGSTIYSWIQFPNGAAANGLNANGDVVGSYTPGSGGVHAFLFSGGVFTDLGTLGSYNARAYAINDSGQITGNFAQGIFAPDYAFRYTSGVTTNLGSLGGPSGSNGFAINNSGLVTGYAYTAGDATYQTFISDGTTMTNLATPGFLASGGYGINSSGQVAGLVYTLAGVQHAMFYDGTNMIDIGTLGGNYGFSRALNDSGQIAGYARTAGGLIHAFSYTGGGGMQDIGTLGGNESFALAINSNGWITGSSNDSSQQNRAFLWNGTTMQDINGLAFTAPLPTVLYQSSGINGAGQIIAAGYDGFSYLLTPQGASTETPEPATWTLIAAGLLLARTCSHQKPRATQAGNGNHASHLQNPPPSVEITSTHRIQEL